MKIIYLICIIVLLSAIMVITPTAAATTRTVCAAGCEYTNIQTALDASSDGDTVFVYNGTYSGYFVSINKPNVTLKGEGADVVTYDGGDAYKIAMSIGEAAAPGCILEGFTITGSLVGGDLVKSLAPDCIIRNNIFDLTFKFGVQLSADNTTFENNNVSNAPGKATTIGGSNCTYRNNTVLNAQHTYMAIDVLKADTAIINNTIKGSKGAAISLDGASAINCIVTKNNLTSNAYAGIELYKAGSGNKIYLNNFIGNKTATTSGTSAPAVTYWNSTEPIEYVWNVTTYTNYLGNYWSDYPSPRIDNNSDGIGDVPYVVYGTDMDFRPLMVGFENYALPTPTPTPEPTLTPQTPFLISGKVNYTSSDPVLNPAVTVRNLATSGEFTVKTVADSNYYRVLTDSLHVSAGNTIYINASDGTVYNGATHIVTASEIETGGFMQDMILDSGDKPDLIVTEKSEEWVSRVEKTYNITYTVANIGSVDADASDISIKIDGVEVGTDSVPALVAGGNYTSTIGPFTMSGDNDMIKVCADSGNVVVEFRESNNCLENLLKYPDMPDLIISRIALKTGGHVNEENILGVTVKNIGSLDANSFNVSLSVDGTPLGEQTAPSLGAGNNTELKFVWIPTELRAYELEAVADTKNEVEESNETNNTFVRTSVIISRMDWPQFHYDEAHVGFSSSKAPNTNNTLWISDGISAIESTAPAVADGKVFVYSGPTGFGGGGAAQLYCFDEFTGGVIWNVSIPAPEWGSWSSPAYHDGKVFTATGKETRSINASNGELIWAFVSPTNEASVNGGPVIADGKVVTNDWQGGHYYCLDEETGELLWTFTEKNTGSWGTGYTQGTPAYADGKVYLTTWVYVGGHVYCVDAETGAEIWHTTLSLDAAGSPTVANGIVYVTTYNFEGDGDIYAMNASNGSILWQQTIQRTDSTPAVAYGNVYVCGGCPGYSGRQTYSFNATTGNRIWETDVSDGIGGWTGSAAVADGKVFVGKIGTFFEYAGTYALDAFTGDIVWSYPEGGSSPAVANGTMFTIGGGGRVYAFGGSKILQKFNISGYKINDTNANGTWDAGEVGIPDWKITLYNSTLFEIANTTTNAAGFYNFSVENGTYNVEEEVKAGWINTSAILRVVTVSGADMVNQNFTNQPVTRIQATVRIKPETLNLNDTEDGVFTAFVTLPDGYDVSDIDVSTVECEGAPALSATISATDTGTFVVKFARADLVDVSVGDAVEMIVTGELTDGTRFEGSDTVRVIAESDEVEEEVDEPEDEVDEVEEE